MNGNFKKAAVTLVKMWYLFITFIIQKTHDHR